jgi:2-dehydropantoate 2-reductase
MSFNKVFVLGAGAIGSAYGALLSKNNDVTLVGNKTHVDVINAKGLALSGDIKEKFFIRADTRIREIPNDTLILLTTKAYDSAKAIEGIKDLLRKDTVILVLQNGLGSKELVQGVVGAQVSVVRGVVKGAAEFFEPGRITVWDGETVLEQTKTGEKIAALFDKSGLKARVSNEMAKEVWNKLVANCLVNPLTAILRAKDNEIIVENLKRVRHGIVEECVKVGEQEGITFEPDLEQAIDKGLSEYENFSSMCQDIMKGKKTEIDFLNGKIVALGRKHSIPTPLNEAMVCMIKFLEGEK